MIRKKQIAKKQQIISEYLNGDSSYDALGKKYGVNPRTIQTWVRAFRKGQPSISSDVAIDKNVKILKKQLEQSQLKNELLEEMLRLSEQHTGIDFRKKYGTKQS
jgi:transposase-like protein